MLPRSRPTLWSSVTAPMVLVLLVVAGGAGPGGYAEPAHPAVGDSVEASASRDAGRAGTKRATLEADGFHDSGERLHLRLTGRAPTRGARKVVLQGRALEDGAARTWQRVSTNGTSRNGRFTVTSGWTRDAEYRVVLPKWNGRRRATSRPIEVPFLPGGPIAGDLEVVPGAGPVREAAMSDDGTVVAYTVATGGRRDIATDLFRYDASTGETVELHPPVDGDPDRYGYEHLRLSADGRWLAFAVMVPGPQAGTYDWGGVLLHDVVDGVHHALVGDGVDLTSFEPSDMSADGATIVGGAWLPEGPTVVAVDVPTGEVELVARTTDGAQVVAHGAHVTDDGGTVFFNTDAPGLVPEDVDETDDAFRYDRAREETSRVSVDDEGRPLARGGGVAAVSGDGGVVSLEDYSDVWRSRLYDRSAGRSRVVELRQDGYLQTFTAAEALSRDGSRAVFGACGGETGQVFLADPGSGSSTRITTDARGYPGNGHAGPIAMSADGRTVLLASDATNLADGPSPTELFLWRERGQG
ncbi:hypothetical protein [uncultured Nocardioides sp.]|uniref:hypothetical protein n=1 Tax=uncultured Nocardioides sp. TaxID=198441 RepID=UPI000C6318D2|nr:hypothetical protein [uncultured Nocardioides sp.]MAO80403.1 hypothetical protein [Nocardioides sp.]